MEVTIQVRLTPRAARNEVTRYEDGILHARVTAPPVDGAANAALIELLASALNVPKSRMRIVGGATSRMKRVSVENFGPAEVEELLGRMSTGRSGEGR